MKLLLFFILLSVTVITSAQTGTKTKPVVKTSTSKPAVKQPALKNPERFGKLCSGCRYRQLL